MFGGIGAGIGGLLGDMWASGDRDKIRAAINALKPLSREEMMRLVQMGPSAFASLKTDPATRQAQMAALAFFGNLGRSNGMDTQSRVAMKEAQLSSAMDDRMRRGAIRQDMASRGMAGSGTDYAMQLASAQDASTRSALAGGRAAADARNRAAQAMAQYGQIGGQVRGQDWGEASDRAGHLDQREMFNAGQRLGGEKTSWGEQMDKTGLLTDYYRQEEERKRRTGAAAGGLVGSAAGAFFGGGF